jgi:hypothetical protein
MRSARSVLALRYTPVSIAGGVRKAVGGFLRYVQYRDQHAEPERDGGLDAYVRYVAHRDRTSPGGRVFGAEAADVDRRRFVDFVMRSTKGLEPRWVEDRDGKKVDRQRAVYTMVLSPEDWRGLDLRRLARTAMTQLEKDAGVGGLGPWFAAEHHNTAHHHVHIVLAARRELSPGRFSTLVITRQRLQRMKDAIAREIDRQRGHEHTMTRPAPRASTREIAPDRPRPKATRQRRITHRACPLRIRRFQALVRMHPSNRRGPAVSDVALRLRGVARGYQLRMERELEQSLEREEFER